MAHDLTFAATPVYGGGEYSQGLASGRATIPAAVIGTSVATVPFTIEMWFQSTSTSGLTVLTGQTKGGDVCWFVGIDGGKLRGYPFSADGRAIPADGSWHHLAITTSTNGFALFVDGTAAGGGAADIGDAPAQLGWYNTAFDFAGLIDEVAVWSGVRYSGATYTVPSAPYTGTEANLRALYHLDGTGADSLGGTAATPTPTPSPTPTPTPTPTPAASTTLIARNATAVLPGFSPFNWHDDGTSMNANSPGAYAHLTFTGTSLALGTVALSGLSEYPRIHCSIDGGPVQQIVLTANATSVALASGLASGTHTVDLLLAASDRNAARWALACALKVTGFIVDAGATVGAQASRPMTAIFYGDSLTETFDVTSNAGNTASSDVSLGVALKVAKVLNAEVGIVAYSGQGFTQAGAGDVPAFNTAYGQHSSGVSRLVNGKLSPAPDYVFCMHGQNGSPTQADIATAIANLRAIAPAARIFMVVPPTGTARAIITAAVTAAINAGDANIRLVDAGAAYGIGLQSYGTPTARSPDGLHQGIIANAEFAAALGALTQPGRFTVVPV